LAPFYSFFRTALASLFFSTGKIAEILFLLLSFALVLAGLTFFGDFYLALTSSLIAAFFGESFFDFTILDGCYCFSYSFLFFSAVYLSSTSTLFGDFDRRLYSGFSIFISTSLSSFFSELFE
jgi:hypothetical protein